MDLFDKFDDLPKRFEKVVALGRNPLGVEMEDITSPTQVVVEGRNTILAGSHNYLGLTFDAECIEAGREALAQFGTGTTGSRIANGTFKGHKQLEQKLSELMNLPTVIVFPTGYQANLGTIAGLAGANDTILIDADSHACIYDGCKMSGATVVRFRHNSPEDLDKRLSRLGDEDSNTLIITEGLFSMYGDTAPLKEIADVKRNHKAYLLVDEAHSVGVYGPNGRGLAEEVGVADDVDFIVGTFSKSLGSIGGFCASNHPKAEYLRYASRPYMFTASISPATVATVMKAADQIEKRPELRDKLWRNSKHLHKGLSDLGFKLLSGVSPIISAEMPDQETAVRCWNLLMDNGVYVNLAIPPGTPKGECLLRASMSAAHSSEEIDQIIEAYAAVKRTVNDFHP